MEGQANAYRKAGEQAVHELKKPFRPLTIIRQKTNLGRPMVVYCGGSVFKTIHDHSKLSINTLPNGRRFNNHVEPYVESEAFRAMLDGGCEDQARPTISNKEKSWISDVIYDDLLNYFYPTKSRFECPVLVQVFRELEYQFQVAEKIKPLDIKTASTAIPQNTSPGLPYINIYPRKKRGEILEMHLENIAQQWEVIGQGQRSLHLQDCAAFARIHIDDVGPNKIRSFWVYPLSVVAAEAMFASPIIEGLKSQKFGLNIAYGMEMKGDIEWLNNQILSVRLQDPGCKFLMTVYSDFDSTVPSWLIRDCFQILEKKFVFPLGQEKYYYNAFQKIKSYFINTRIRNSDGRRLLTGHGIPSGSMFTNIIGSMVNFIVTRYTIKRLMLSDPVFDIYSGDDSIIGLRGSSLVNIDDIANLIEEGFGMKLDIEKSYYTTKIQNVHFLGCHNQFGALFPNI